MDKKCSEVMGEPGTFAAHKGKNVASSPFQTFQAYDDSVFYFIYFYFLFFFIPCDGLN